MKSAHRHRKQALLNNPPVTLRANRAHYLK